MIKLALFFLCLLPCLAFSQIKKQVAFRELTVDQGLSQNSVVDIAQDSIGYMWFATQDGLNKYDGRNFTHYDIQFEDVTRPKFSKLGKLYVDREGNLWVVSNSGTLEKYNPEKDEFQPVHGLGKVSTLIQTNKNNFYIGTFGQGIYKVNEQKRDTIQLLAPEDAQRTVYDFLETDDHTIWATTSNGVFKFYSDQYDFIKIRSNVNFSTLAEAEDNTLYLGSYGNGLFIKKPNTEKFTVFPGFDSQNLPEDLIIQDLLVDKRNRLWVATYGQGAYLINFEEKTLRHFTENKNNPYAIHYKDVISLFEDNTGTIWLGTDGAGLSYYDEYLVKFNLLTNQQVPLSVNLDVVRAIVKTKENILWAGTSGKGLTRLDLENKDFHTFTRKNSDILGGRIMSLLYEEGRLWIGHQTKGLQMINQKGNFFTFKDTDGFTIWKIYQDKNDILWLCTRRNGLVKFDKDKGIVKKYSRENSSLTTNNIRTIEPGDEHTLWIGTETKGLFKFNPQTDNIENINALNNKIKSLYYNNPLLWTGTNGSGLKSYNVKTGEINTYSKKDGLPNNVVYGILPDSSGALWLSSNKGITQLKVGDEEITNLVNYNKYGGLQASEFNTGAYYKDEDGTLYFGGLEGINWFKPSQLSFNPLKPKTVISRFEVFGQKRKLKPEQELSHKENTVSFHFSSLQFSKPERNQYKYILVNNDEDWIHAGNTNVAHYTNLPPNDYEFKVISSNYDGLWSEDAATYSFTVLNPWYATVWANVFYGLLFLLIIYFLYKYLKWRWEIKLQLRLKHEETQRLKKLDDLKTKLYTNISHEFRTPLTLISGPVENQLAKPEISKKDKEELVLVKQNADRLLNLVDQMVDLSIIESGHQHLTVGEGQLNLLLKQIVSAFQFKANRKKITIEPDIADLDKAWFDRDVIEKVVSNLLANAIKYAPTNSKVDFKAHKKGNNVVIGILNKADNTDKKNLDKLFQRFYQDDELSEGIGIGLALVRELVTLSKGSINVNKVADGRIEFKVILPVSKEAFAGEKIVTDKTAETPKSTFQKNAKTPSEGKPLLLIVEDDRELRTYIKSIFENNYQIAEAENGQVGIDKALDILPDLIISDIIMPVRDGIALCNNLKTNELTSHIPIILLTAKVGDKSEIEGLKTGADAYLTKPFHSEKLKIRVEKLIENRRQLQKHFANALDIDSKSVTNSAESEFLKRLQNVLKEELTNSNFTIDNFAELMNMSRSQLHRKLKAITGMSASAFVRSKRVKIAADLLKKSDAPISEIAYRVGFNSASYFNKCFKEVYHCTPNQYLGKEK